MLIPLGAEKTGGEGVTKRAQLLNIRYKMLDLIPYQKSRNLTYSSIHVQFIYILLKIPYLGIIRNVGKDANSYQRQTKDFKNGTYLL